MFRIVRVNQWLVDWSISTTIGQHWFLRLSLCPPVTIWETGTESKFDETSQHLEDLEWLWFSWFVTDVFLWRNHTVLWLFLSSCPIVWYFLFLCLLCSFLLLTIFALQLNLSSLFVYFDIPFPSSLSLLHSSSPSLTTGSALSMRTIENVWFWPGWASLAHH